MAPDPNIDQAGRFRFGWSGPLWDLPPTVTPQSAKVQTVQRWRPSERDGRRCRCTRVDRNLKSGNAFRARPVRKVGGCNTLPMTKCSRHRIRNCSTCKATYGTDNSSAWIVDTSSAWSSSYDSGSASSSCDTSSSSSSSSSDCGGGF